LGPVREAAVGQGKGHACAKTTWPSCASIEANPDDWRDDEAIAGEDGPPREEQEMLDELQEAVRTAQTLPQLINALYREELPG